MYKNKFLEGITLAIYKGNEIVFSSKGKWLHPLFEAEKFLESCKYNVDELSLHDTISGLAAASLTVHLGFKKVHVDILSQGALSLYIKHGVEITYEKLIDKIQCMTESLLNSDMSIADCYKKLRKKANLTQGLDLRVEDLCFSYGSKKIFDKLSFVLQKGDNIILEGDNGSGKTTLIKLILGLEPKASGNIFFDGEIKSYEIAYIKQFQDSDYFPFTVEEVIKTNAQKTKYINCEIELALRRVGGYHLLKRNYHTLSGGEKAKVNLARALCSKAKLIIMDEVTASMDLDSKKNFIDIINSLSTNEMPTIILVNHDKYVFDNLSWPRLRLEGGCFV